MHYYKRNLGDYAKKAGRLSMLQHGSYTLLIDACYDREQFPTLEDAIEWTWASTTEEVEAVQFVLRKFFTLEGGVYVQKRIQEEIAEYQRNAATNKRIADERETKRREKSTNRAPLVDGASPGVNEAPPNHKPLTKNQSIPKTSSLKVTLADRPDEVDQKIWDDYKAIRKAKNAPLTDTALAGVRREAVKAGITLQAAIVECCERGWSGFKAEWYLREHPRPGESSQRPPKFDPVAYVNQGKTREPARTEKVIDAELVG